MNILAFDTSNVPLSVAVGTIDEVLSEYTTSKKKTHSVTLFPAIQQTLEDAGLSIHDIDEIVVSQGPGSFTGLRIAVTSAKELALANEIKLIGISSLKLIACNVKSENTLLVPYFDARRGNVFAGGYVWENGKLKNVIEDAHYSISELVRTINSQSLPVIMMGNEVEDLNESVSEFTNFSVDNTNVLPHAGNLIKLSKEETPVDNIHDFNPKYLRRTKSEMDWLKTHDDENENYVEKI